MLEDCIARNPFRSHIFQSCRINSIARSHSEPQIRDAGSAPHFGFGVAARYAACKPNFIQYKLLWSLSLTVTYGIRQHFTVYFATFLAGSANPNRRT